MKTLSTVMLTCPGCQQQVSLEAFYWHARGCDPEREKLQATLASLSTSPAPSVTIDDDFQQKIRKAVLIQIEQRGFDVFSKRVSLPVAEKCWIVLRAWMGGN